jgi:hypothetical protein
MKTVQWLSDLFNQKGKETAPVLIIKKDSDGYRVREFQSAEDAISDLENNPDAPVDKIKKLKSSLLNLKNKNSITIRNGEIIT